MLTTWKPELKRFHDWLIRDTSDYLSMVLHGSVAAGDPWIEGHSDCDIILVYEKDQISHFAGAQAYLKGSKFDDHFHFFPIKKNDFLAPGSGTFAFSNAFRTKVLFGKDILKKKEYPKRAAAGQLFGQEIEKQKASLQIYLVNSHKSVRKMRKEFWKLFKHTFMLLAIKIYAETGTYPKTRGEVIKLLHNPIVLRETWETLHFINDKSKEEILRAGQNLLCYLQAL